MLNKIFCSTSSKPAGNTSPAFTFWPFPPLTSSDMLRSLTGQNAQAHIHSRIIAQAKALLSTTALSVSEIAYRLGFGYPQSFNKLFKAKVDVSPLQFRASFN